MLVFESLATGDVTFFMDINISRKGSHKLKASHTIRSSHLCFFWICCFSDIYLWKTSQLIFII